MRLPVYGLPMVILAQKAAFGMNLVAAGHVRMGQCVPALPWIWAHRQHTARAVQSAFVS